MPLLPSATYKSILVYEKTRCERPKKGHKKFVAGKYTPLALPNGWMEHHLGHRGACYPSPAGTLAFPLSVT